MHHLYTKSKCNAIIWFSCKCTKQLRQYQLFIKHEWRSFDIKNKLCFQNLQYHYIDKLNWLLTFCIKGNIYYTFTCTKSIEYSKCFMSVVKTLSRSPEDTLFSIFYFGMARWIAILITKWTVIIDTYKLIC